MLIIYAAFNIIFKFTIARDTYYVGEGTTYVNAVHWLEGGEPDNPKRLTRLLKPLGPAGIILISEISGLDFYDSLMVEVIVFYIALAIAIYFFVQLFFENKYLALLGAIFYISTYPMLFYDLNLLTESGANFFYVLSAIFVYKFYVDPKNRYFYYSVLIIILGILWKEYEFQIGLLLGLAILLHPDLKLKNKLYKILIYGALVAITWGSWQVFVYLKWHYTYLSWSRGPSGIDLFFQLKSIFALVLAGWLLVPFGALGWKKFSKRQRIMIILLIIICTPMVLFWFGINSRLYYPLVLPLIILIMNGFEYLCQRYSPYLGHTLYVVAILSNYIWLLIGNNFRQYLGIHT